MDKTSLRSLLAQLPVLWWEADGQLRTVESGGGAFGDDTRTARRFLDTLRPDIATPWRSPGTRHWQVRFERRVFDVSWPLGDAPAGGRTRGVAAVAGAGTTADRRDGAFADFVPAPAFIRDHDGRYLWANHAYAHRYGTTPENVIGKTVHELHSPPPRPSSSPWTRTSSPAANPCGTPSRTNATTAAAGRPRATGSPSGRARRPMWRASTWTSPTAPGR